MRPHPQPLPAVACTPRCTNLALGPAPDVARTLKTPSKHLPRRILEVSAALFFWLNKSSRAPYLCPLISNQAQVISPNREHAYRLRPYLKHPRNSHTDPPRIWPSHRLSQPRLSIWFDLHLSPLTAWSALRRIWTSDCSSPVPRAATCDKTRRRSLTNAQTPCLLIRTDPKTRSASHKPPSSLGLAQVILL